MSGNIAITLIVRDEENDVGPLSFKASYHRRGAETAGNEQATQKPTRQARYDRPTAIPHARIDLINTRNKAWILGGGFHFIQGIKVPQ